MCKCFNGCRDGGQKTYQHISTGKNCINLSRYLGEMLKAFTSFFTYFFLTW